MLRQAACIIALTLAMAPDVEAQEHAQEHTQEHTQELRTTGTQEHRGTGAQEHEAAHQEHRSTGAQEHNGQGHGDRPAPKGHVESAPPPASVVTPPWVAEVTDEMRQAAFPDVQGHAAHDRHVNGFVLFDQLEWRSGNGPGTLSWSNTGWVGGDIHRLWFRTEADVTDAGADDGRVHALYGRAIARWWDVVGGVRQDVQPGAQTWLAVGVQGLAPGFFDVEATAYLSDEGQTAAHLEVEYDVLITNRVVLQPVVEMEFYGKSNASIGVGSGMSSAAAGLRLRYQLTREFAPYVGVAWVKALGDTANLADDSDLANGAPRLVTGVRVWF
jgi:copper resistance protein B